MFVDLLFRKEDQSRLNHIQYPSLLMTRTLQRYFYLKLCEEAGPVVKMGYPIHQHLPRREAPSVKVLMLFWIIFVNMTRDVPYHYIGNLRLLTKRSIKRTFRRNYHFGLRSLNVASVGRGDRFLLEWRQVFLQFLYKKVFSNHLLERISLPLCFFHHNFRCINLPLEVKN